MTNCISIASFFLKRINADILGGKTFEKCIDAERQTKGWMGIEDTYL
jgi:hypothetical protein